MQMKKLNFTLFFTCIVCFAMNAQSWQMVGGNPVSTSAVELSKIVLDTQGTPYVTFKGDGSYGWKISVLKLNSDTWEAVGSLSFSNAPVNYPSLALDANNTPYVAFLEEGNGHRARAMKYNGTSWSYMGDYVSAGEVSYVNIMSDNDNNVYVAYRDHSLGYKACVKKWNSAASTWDYVGNAAFSDGPADKLDFKLDNNNTPYVAFKDESGGYKLSVMKFDGTAWVYVGGRSSSPGIVSSMLSLDIDNNNVPYVTYINESASNKASMLKFEDGVWKSVGDATFSQGEVSYLDMTIDTQGSPYVTYRDHSLQYKAFVRKFESGVWSYKGSSETGFSNGASGHNSIAINKTNNSLYVALTDESQANKCYVWTLGNLVNHMDDLTGNELKIMRTGPDMLRISNLEQGVVKIFSINGSLVYSGNVSANGTLDINLKQGAYLLRNNEKVMKFL